LGVCTAMQSKLEFLLDTSVVCLAKQRLKVGLVTKAYPGVTKRAISAQISSIPCQFVLWEAVSQTKYCCSLKVKRFPPPTFWTSYATGWFNYKLLTAVSFCSTKPMRTSWRLKLKMFTNINSVWWRKSHSDEDIMKRQKVRHQKKQWPAAVGKLKHSNCRISNTDSTRVLLPDAKKGFAASEMLSQQITGKIKWYCPRTMSEQIFRSPDTFSKNVNVRQTWTKLAKVTGDSTAQVCQLPSNHNKTALETYGKIVMTSIFLYQCSMSVTLSASFSLFFLLDIAVHQLR